MHARYPEKSTMDSDAWCSPPSVANALEQLFSGPVGTDPCSNPNSIIKANVALHAGGLHLPWWTKRAGKERTAYENFPFSKPLPWTNKMLVELGCNLQEHVRLGPVSTSTLWWRRMCGVDQQWIDDPKSYKGINPRLIFTGRLKFIGDVSFGARFDVVIAYYGRRVKAFEREFKHVTKWLSWGRA